MADLRTILEMRDALRQTEGWQIGADLTRLLRTRRVFAGNRDELERFLSEVEEIPRALELMAQDNREELHTFLNEVERLLHNFLAAAMTLRDHSRDTSRRLLPPDDRDELAEAYRQRIDLVFAESPLAQFVEDLRHVALHVRLPALLGRAHWSRDEGWSSGVVLHRDFLLARGDWGALAKEYVEEAGEQFALLDVVRDYSGQVDEFHDWFRRALVERHRGPFANSKSVTVSCSSSGRRPRANQWTRAAYSRPAEVRMRQRPRLARVARGKGDRHKVSFGCRIF